MNELAQTCSDGPPNPTELDKNEILQAKARDKMLREFCCLDLVSRSGCFRFFLLAY